MKGYRIEEKQPDGQFYVVAELDDGATFGQICRASTIEELEDILKEAERRLTGVSEVTELDALVGQSRTFLVEKL